jgi:hypothetical protein
MTKYSPWFDICGKLSNRECEYSEIKNTLMFSTFTVTVASHAYARGLGEALVSV